MLGEHDKSTLKRECIRIMRYLVSAGMMTRRNKEEDYEDVTIYTMTLSNGKLFNISERTAFEYPDENNHKNLLHVFGAYEKITGDNCTIARELLEKREGGIKK